MSEAQVNDEFRQLATRLVKELNNKQKHGKTLVLKLRTASFETVTKRLTKQDYFLNDVATIVYLSMAVI